MKTKKFLSVMLTGVLALGAASQGVCANALCVDDKCELNKPYELNCNMDSLEAMKHLCKDFKDLSYCIKRLHPKFREALFSSQERLKWYLSANEIETAKVEKFRENLDEYCRALGCEDKSYFDKIEDAVGRELEIYRWVYQCIKKGE